MVPVIAESLFSFPGIITSCSWKCFPFIAAIDLNPALQIQCGEKGAKTSRAKPTAAYLPQPACQQTEYFMASYSCLSGIVWFLEQGQCLQKKRALKHIISLAVEHGTYTIPCPVLFPPCQPMTAVHINFQNSFFLFSLFYHLCSQHYY